MFFFLFCKTDNNNLYIISLLCRTVTAKRCHNTVSTKTTGKWTRHFGQWPSVYHPRKLCRSHTRGKSHTVELHFFVWFVSAVFSKYSGYRIYGFPSHHNPPTTITITTFFSQKKPTHLKIIFVTTTTKFNFTFTS